VTTRHFKLCLTEHDLKMLAYIIDQVDPWDAQEAHDLTRLLRMVRGATPLDAEV
jgi:hypothetical protein